MWLYRNASRRYFTRLIKYILCRANLVLYLFDRRLNYGLICAHITNMSGGGYYMDDTMDDLDGVCCGNRRILDLPLHLSNGVG